MSNRSSYSVSQWTFHRHSVAVVKAEYVKKVLTASISRKLEPAVLNYVGLRHVRASSLYFPHFPTQPHARGRGNTIDIDQPMLRSIELAPLPHPNPPASLPRPPLALHCIIHHSLSSATSSAPSPSGSAKGPRGRRGEKPSGKAFAPPTSARCSGRSSPAPTMPSTCSAPWSTRRLAHPLSPRPNLPVCRQAERRCPPPPAQESWTSRPCSTRRPWTWCARRSSVSA